MRVFVVNAGSSSIKYQLVDAASGEAVLRGALERIGEPGGDAADHVHGMRLVLDRLGELAAGIAAVGHRVVHGGNRFAQPVVIDDEVEAAIADLSALAPLHNPANVQGIQAARSVLPNVPHVAVFDTAFHQSMPPEAFTYAIDAQLAAQHDIRRYGFHGTSYRFVAHRAAEFLARPIGELKLIVFHLGNGSSAAAIDGGRSIETSMGLTPLQGLVMGTRAGDLDAAILPHLSRVAGLNLDELDLMLNTQSGLLGLTGSGDMRDVQERASRGDEVAESALAVWRHRVRHYLGAYMVHLGGLDAIVFTAGIGENNALLRRRSLADMEWLGIRIDNDRNELNSRSARRISSDDSAVQVLVVPTNEELAIAEATAALVG
jgi:acetate kinase